MKAFDHALLIGGAATALLGGVATAQLGLAPIHQAVAEAAPSPDTMAADASEPIRADLQSDAMTHPPAVIVPVRASTPKAPQAATPGEDAPKSDADARQGDGDDVREVVAREPSLEFDSAPEAHPAVQDAEQDRDPPIQVADPPAEDPAPVTPG